MSLKEDIESVKKEISTEESFMENFFKVEKFYKKYKSIIIGTVSIAIVAVIGYYVTNYMNEQNKLEANKLFNTLMTNPKDANTLTALKQKDEKLYNIALFMQDNTKASDVEFLKELSLYTQAIKENNVNKITTISQNQDFLLKDFAIFNKALIEVQNNKYKEAKLTLKQIPKDSGVISLVKMLEHFLLTK